MSENTVASRQRSTVSSTGGMTEHQRHQLAELVRQHQMTIYAYLRARVAQPVDADDLLQEVFLRYQAGIGRYDPSRDPLPYLMGIARNLLRERARRLRRRQELTWTELCLEVEEPAEEETLVSPHQELVPHLASCLQTLAQNARTALQLYYEHKLKFKEIGQRLGRTAGAVKLLMFRARQALKRCLDLKLGSDHPDTPDRSASNRKSSGPSDAGRPCTDRQVKP